MAKFKFCLSCRPTTCAYPVSLLVLTFIFP